MLQLRAQVPLDTCRFERRAAARAAPHARFQADFHMPLPDLRKSWSVAADAGADAADTGGGTETALDLILIEGLRAHTVIGIHDSELHTPQPVRIDLVAGVPRSHACVSDRIEDAIDYGAVRAGVRALLAQHPYRLLEALAEAIAQMVLRDFDAAWVRVAVVKPAKFDDVDAVGVAIERRRGRSPSPRAEGSAASVLSLLGAGMIPGHRSR